MSLNAMLEGVRSKTSTYQGFEPEKAEITFFRVIKVTPEDRKVDIEFAHSKIIERGVSYMSPFLGSKGGADFIPSVGDLGLVATTAVNGRIIIGFITGSERSMGSAMDEGDIATSSSGSIVKQDSAGNIVISTSSGSSIVIDKEGYMLLSSKEIEITSDAQSRVDGLFIDGAPVSTTTFFDGVMEVDYDDFNALIDDIMNGEPVATKPRRPVVKIHGVRKADVYGEGETLEIAFDETDGLKVYEIEVVSDSGQTLSSLSFDKNGNIEIKANRLTFNVNDIAYK